MNKKGLKIHTCHLRDDPLSKIAVPRHIGPIILSLCFLIVGCAWWRPNHPTPMDALIEFPGYVTQQELTAVEVLHQENIAGGLVLLYRYPLYKSGTTSSEYCVVTTFVTEEQQNSWRSQSASKIGCGDNYPYVEDFMAMYTVGGNITDLTTAYGFSSRGTQVRIKWSDGVVDIATIQNGVFLKSRPQILQVESIELLDKNGEVLENKTWTTP